MLLLSHLQTARGRLGLTIPHFPEPGRFVMRFYGVLALTLGLLIVADLAAVADRPSKKKEDPVREELKKLQGTWRVVSMEQNGAKVFIPNPGAAYTVVIKGKSYVFKMGNRVVVQGTFTINPSRKPKTMDCVPSSGSDKGKVQKSIYELRGDTMKECGALAGKNRPTEFAAGRGSGHILAIYKRMK
jgi:uncharacterized protein (TIGR03067 family)